MGVSWEEIKQAFRKLFGREMTPDEEKYLSLADHGEGFDDENSDAEKTA